MVNLRLISGTSMVNLWLIYGTSMVNLWLIYGTSMVNLWLIYGTSMVNLWLITIYLIGGLEDFLFSISYMGCHPSHWLTHISSEGLKPPTRLVYPFFEWDAGSSVQQRLNGSPAGARSASYLPADHRKAAQQNMVTCPEVGAFVFCNGCVWAIQHFQH